MFRSETFYRNSNSLFLDVISQYDGWYNKAKMYKDKDL